jgi:hypothetical protein
MNGLKLRSALVLLLIAGAGWSGDNPPPVKCGRQNAGSYWPEAANRDAAVRRRAERCGTLRYCARTTFGWKWKQLTVTLQSLIAKAGGEQQSTVDAACATEPAAAESQH